MTREKDEIETIFNFIDTVFDGDARHGMALQNGWNGRMNCGLANGERAKIQAVSLLPWIGPTALLANPVDTAVDAAERPDLPVRTGGAGSVGQVPIIHGFARFYRALTAPRPLNAAGRPAQGRLSRQTRPTRRVETHDDSSE
jgi:hypothetical protein